jgi:hypothetical protein
MTGRTTDPATGIRPPMRTLATVHPAAAALFASSTSTRLDEIASAVRNIPLHLQVPLT